MNQLRSTKTTSGRSKQRSGGFTLIELLVVVGILLLLLTITLTTVNLTIDGDRVRGTARQVQSYLEGARDRAIYARRPRGVRFLLDTADTRLVSSMVYITESDPWEAGTVVIERRDENNDGTVDSDPTLALMLRGVNTSWKRLFDRGLISDGARIEVPARSGQFYTVRTSLLPNANGGTYPERLILQTPYRTTPSTDAAQVTALAGTQSYRLDLPPIELQGESPVQFTRNTVIQLDRCSTSADNSALSNTTRWGNTCSSSWRVNSPSTATFGFFYRPRLDIMFSPRGSAVGPAAARGLIHLYVADRKDAIQDRIDWEAGMPAVPQFGPRLTDGAERGDKLVVTIFTRTGAISSHPVSPGTEDDDQDGVLDAGEDDNGNGILDVNPMEFAETGEAASR